MTVHAVVPEPAFVPTGAIGPAPLVRVAGVTKRYGQHRALDRVDLDVEAGTIMAVTGANGAGKSTLLAIIAGASQPCEGTVHVADARSGVRTGRDVGVLTHATMLYDRLSGRENLLLHARLRRLPTERVTAVLEGVGLEHAADRMVSEYSHGMRKRLSIARSLLHDPSVLVLDEPFAGLDAAAQERLGTLIAALGRERTVIFSSHEPGRVAAHADRVVTLVRGRVATDTSNGAHEATSAPPAAGPGRHSVTAPRADAGPAPGLPGGDFLHAIGAMLRKDLVLEMRTRATVIAMAMLAGLLAVVLGIAFEPLSADPAVVGGTLWVVVTFAVMHGLSRAFDAEFRDDALRGLVLAGSDPAALFLGKVLGTALLTVLVATVTTLMIAVLFAAPELVRLLPSLLVLMALAAIGLSAVGAVATVIARHAALGETMLPLLFLPLVVPVLLAGIASIPTLLETGALHAGWVRVLLMYDVAVTVGAAIFFEYVLED